MAISNYLFDTFLDKVNVPDSVCTSCVHNVIDNRNMEADNNDVKIAFNN